MSCLESIDEAAAAWTGDVLTVVGADSCVDPTAALSRRFRSRSMRTFVIEGSWGSASRARQASIVHGLLQFAARDASTWIANTDADCRVPPSWIARQVTEADGGADVVLGVVQLDAATPPRLAARFAALYDPREGATHPHVHAANFGLRASAYRHTGGWNHRVVVGEEHELLHRALTAKQAVVRLADHHVITSGRTVSRVDGGFASVLASLHSTGQGGGEGHGTT